MQKIILKLSPLVAVVLLTACASGGVPGPFSSGSGEVVYGSTKTVSAVSNQFGTTDYKIAAKEIVRKLLSTRVIADAKTPPRISFKEIENKTGEYGLDTSTLSEMVRDELLGSGAIRVVRDNIATAEAEMRQNQVDAMRGMQNNKKTVQRVKADYWLDGSVKSVVAKGGGVKQVDYFVQLEMYDPSTSEQIWSGRSEIRKTSASNR